MKEVERALLVAENAHRGQVYDKIYPYTYHIKKVVQIAQELGYGEDIQVACALHDVLEDTSLSYNDIKKAFGEEIAEIVYAVTDELGRNRNERKHKTYPKIKENWKAIVVKICDRIANMEHSKNYSPYMYRMYQEELLTFKSHLMVGIYGNKTNPAWNKLLKENEITTKD